MEKKVPEIRFKGFDGKWTSATLGDCFIERIERSADGELLSVTINSGIVLASETGRTDNSSNDKSNYKVVKKGDLAYNSMRMWQGACGHSEYDGIVSPAYTVVTPKDGCDVEYFHYSFKNNDTLYRFRVNSQGLTSDTWNLKYPLFSEIDCKYPSDEAEQKKIASLFKTLDRLIRSLELKLEKLKNIKQSLLNQMFTNGNGGGEPLIRFKNYNSDWQMIKLGSITHRVTRKNSNNESSMPLTVSAQYGLVDQSTFFNSRIASSNLSGYYLVYNGEFAYNKSSSDGYPFGAVKRLERHPCGVLSTLYIVFEVDDSSIDSDYVSTFYDSKHWHNQVREKAAEGARNHGLLNISADDFFDTYLSAPETKNEQITISRFFFQLNRLIDSETDNLRKAQTFKQSLLQKMFVN